MLQSETYTPVYSETIAHEYSINYNAAVHGRDGPVQVSYPKYFYPQSGESSFELNLYNVLILKANLFAAMNLLGEYLFDSTDYPFPLG